MVCGWGWGRTYSARAVGVRSCCHLDRLASKSRVGCSLGFMKREGLMVKRSSTRRLLGKGLAHCCLMEAARFDRIVVPSVRVLME